MTAVGTGPSDGAAVAATEERSGRRLTGERPMEGVTPDSLLALHAAGYRTVIERLGSGTVLDVGCGQGFESARLLGEGRTVVGADYSAEAVGSAAGRWRDNGLRVAQMDARALGFAGGTFDWACSSHLIEHFADPEHHVRELARVLGDDGTAFFLTPNAPADFENPFHIHLFEPDELGSLLRRWFSSVTVQGLDAVPRVKADFTARRVKANKVLKLDVFDLRHRIPRSWYIAAYTRALPIAYKVIARGDAGGATGITADDFFVTDELDPTTMVLFATASRPRRTACARPVLAVGLTGGIGAGKSTVAALLVERGAVLVDADTVAREVVEPGGPAYQPLVERFGREILDGEGRIDRPRLAGLVFGHPDALADLNAITHPAIGVEMLARKDRYAATDEIVVLDIPLLRAEHRELLALAAVVVVDAPPEVALERLTAKRGMGAEDAKARMASQPDRAARLEGADLVVDNSGDEAALRREVERVWRSLLERRAALGGDAQPATS
jgi:dephospho-CoA kinase